MQRGKSPYLGGGKVQPIHRPGATHLQRGPAREKSKKRMGAKKTDREKLSPIDQKIGSKKHNRKRKRFKTQLEGKISEKQKGGEERFIP